MAARKEDHTITMNSSSEARIELVKTIVTYEAKLAGATRGQALRDMVMRRAEARGLPDEVRAQLAAIDAERVRAAARASVGFSGPAGVEKIA